MSYVKYRKAFLGLSLILVILGLAFVFQPASLTLAAVIGANDLRLSDMGGIGTANINIAEDPAIAFNSTGNEYLVVWIGTETNANGEQSKIYGQRINAESGAEIGTNDFVIGITPGGADPKRDATDPAVIYNATNDEYLVVFVGQPSTTSTESEVYGQRVAANGSLLGSTLAVSLCGAPGDSSADVGVTFGHPIDLTYNATDNQYLVVWRCDDVGDGGIVNGEFEIIGRIVNANGTLFGADDFQISQVGGSNGTNTQYDAESPKVVWNNVNNEYLVTWGADNSTLGDGNREIFGQRLNNSGGEIGTNDFKISTTLHGGSKDSAVSDLAYDVTTNQYLVVWEGDIAVDNTGNIFGQRLNGTNGAIIGGSINISQNGAPAGPAKEPTVVYNGLDGEFLVIWQADMSPGEREIFGQRLSAVGAEIGPNDFRISDLGPEGNGSFDAESTNSLAYAGTSLNSYYAIWYGQDDRGGQVMAENEIFGQVIEPVLEIVKTITSPTVGVDAGDTVQYTIEVQHKQAVEGANSYDVSLYDAYNLTITDTLPSELQNYSVISATINPGNIDVSGSFDITGNQLTTIDPNVDLLWAARNGSGHESLAIVIEGTASDQVSPNQEIGANTAYLAWENHASGLSHPGYDANDSSNKITICELFDVTKSASVNQVTIGDVVTYTLEIEVIEGTTNNLSLVDTLPSGMSYLAGSAQISNANGMTIGSFTVTNPGNQVNISIGSVVNPGNVDDASSLDSDSFFITYQAQVLNVSGNQTSTDLVNDVDASATSLVPDNNNSATVTIVEPELSISKSADDTSPAFDQTVSYSVTVSHSSGSLADANDIVVTDTVPSGLSYVAGSASLPPGQVDETDPTELIFAIPLLTLSNGTTSFSYLAKVDGPSINDLGDQLTNSQVLTWSSQPGESANERTGEGGLDDYRTTTSETVTVTGPDMVLTKDDGDKAGIPGSAITYTLTYSNAGNNLATGVALTETVPASTTFDKAASSTGWSCADGSPPGTNCLLNLGSVPGGSGGSVDFVVSVDRPLPAGIEQTNNVASIVDDGSHGIDPTPKNNIATDVTLIDAAPDLQIEKDDGGIVISPGGTVSYTLTYTNAGNQAATGVTITETVPANTSFNAAASTGLWTCVPDNSAGSICTLNVGSLAGDGSGGSEVYGVTVANPVGASTTGIDNTVVIGDDGNSGLDLDTSDNISVDNTPIDAAPDLVLVKDDDGITAIPGDTISYTLTYSNTGNQSASGVTITETIPANTGFDVGASTTGWNCVPDTSAGSICTLSLGSVDAGMIGTANFAVDIVDPLPAGISTIDNSAFIHDDGTSNGDRIPGNNVDGDSTPVDAAPDLQIGKDDGDITVLPGEKITYTLTFTNAGQQGATGVNISETVPANTSFVASASTAGWNCVPDASAGSSCDLTIGTVAGGGAAGLVNFVVSVDDPFPAGTAMIDNTATIGDDGKNGADVSTADNSDADTTPVDGPPSITSLDVNPNVIDEDESVQLSLTIVDPDLQESHGVTIDWGDGYTKTTSLITGTLTLSDTHLYLDDDPTGTSSDIYQIQVVVLEADGDSDSGDTSLTVNNVLPLVGIGPDRIATVNGVLSFTGVFTDPGSLDTFDIAWDFGDGTTVTNTLVPTHTYPVTGTYTVALTVTDDDLGVGTDQLTVTVDLPKIFVPVFFNNTKPSFPDLVVERLDASDSNIQLMIRNIGTTPADEDFWVDVYIDPNPVPTTVNQTWSMLANEGLLWGVTGTTLNPGQALPLTIGGPFFMDNRSDFSGSIAPGTAIYAQVDSANTQTDYRGVLESHEYSGEPYNNIVMAISPTAPLGNGFSINNIPLAEADLPRGKPTLPERPEE